MKSKNRYSALTVLASICFSIQGIQANDDAAKAIPSNNIQFEQVAPFVKMGSAWGDRSSGAHGTFGLFPGNAASPLHNHSGAYHGVVISGTMTNPFGNEANPLKMGPGSYWFVPAGADHVTACISEAPCMFYFHAEGAFDFTPISN